MPPPRGAAPSGRVAILLLIHSRGAGHEPDRPLRICWRLVPAQHHPIQETARGGAPRRGRPAANETSAKKPRPKPGPLILTRRCNEGYGPLPPPLSLVGRATVGGQVLLELAPVVITQKRTN